MSACRMASSSMVKSSSSRSVVLLGGPAPVRRFLPHLMDLVLERKIEPGKVFDLTLPLTDVAEGYRAMDERRAISACCGRKREEGCGATQSSDFEGTRPH